MDLVAIATRMSVSRSRVASVPYSTQVITPKRELSKCKSETTFNPMNLSQAEFIASQRTLGEPEMDFIDVLLHADEIGVDPEDIATAALEGISPQQVILRDVMES